MTGQIQILFLTIRIIPYTEVFTILHNVNILTLILPVTNFNSCVLCTEVFTFLQMNTLTLRVFSVTNSPKKGGYTLIIYIYIIYIDIYTLYIGIVYATLLQSATGFNLL